MNELGVEIWQLFLYWNGNEKGSRFFDNVNVKKLKNNFSFFFLKFKKLVRIDNIENCKNDMKNLIDIIEPFDLEMSIRIKKIIYI